MNDITRTEAIKELKSIRTDPWTDHRQMKALEMAINSLKVDEMYDLTMEDPDAFVRKVKGRWINECVGQTKQKDFPKTRIIETYMNRSTCSECFASYSVATSDKNTYIDYRFCPNCGADMRDEA